VSGKVGVGLRVGVLRGGGCGGRHGHGSPLLLQQHRVACLLAAAALRSLLRQLTYVLARVHPRRPHRGQHAVSRRLLHSHAVRHALLLLLLELLRVRRERLHQVRCLGGAGPSAGSTRGRRLRLL